MIKTTLKKPIKKMKVGDIEQLNILQGETMKHYKAYLNEYYHLSGYSWSVDIMKQIKRLKRRINRLKPLNYYQALDKMRLLDKITRLYYKLDPSKL